MNSIGRVFAILWVLFCGWSPALSQETHLVPSPVSLTTSNESLVLPAEIGVVVDPREGWSEHLQVVAEVLSRLTNGKHVVSTGDGPTHLKVQYDAALQGASYQLVVGANDIQISASSLKGLTHATATLLQLIGGAQEGRLSCVNIQDEPELGYRSFMIDMGRNPHSLELLKETIDLLWFYKVDSLHLHLTDDQRFAFPSTAFPKLWDQRIDLQSFRQLDDYARIRGVTIIPELEVPGHSSMIRRLYPETFGESATDLAKSETALNGIKTLLDEMMAAFPSAPMIHIGGDEAFGVPEELQRSLINKLHAYLKSKGKKTIVWEGPRPGEGDNKVNEEVIHINWRTINYPADQMLAHGYPVVNAAWDPLYLVDHYPRTNFTMTSRQHIYETMKLTRFKHVNPGISTFAKPIEVEPSDQLIGFCMPWWEGREENYFPQVTPRLVPFAEVSWNHSGNRDFAGFDQRYQACESVRARCFNPVEIVATDLVIPADGVFHNQTTVSAKVRDAQFDGEIRYTVDGTQPKLDSPKFEKTVQIAKSTKLRAALFVEGVQVGHESRMNLTCVTPKPNLALGKPVSSSLSSEPPFSAERVTDGGTDNLEFYLGYPATPEPLLLTIDLGENMPVQRVVVHAYTISNSFEKYAVEVSDDGKNFEEVASRMERPNKTEGRVEHRFSTKKIRYVRVKSFGNKGYVFDSFSKLVEVEVFGPEE